MCAVVVSKTSWKHRNHPILRGVITPHHFFFLKTLWFFSIFNQFFHGCCGETYTRGRPEVPNSYLLTSWPELIVVIHGEYIPPGTHSVNLFEGHHTYTVLHTPPPRVPSVSLPWGRNRWLTTLTSWRSLSPEPPKSQYLLTGPIPQRSDLRYLHPVDEVTRQPRGLSHRSQSANPGTPRTCGWPTWTSPLHNFVRFGLF
jgi:hypothetical protein